MVPAGSSRSRALLLAALLLGLAVALLELAAYRLDAAVFGWGYARLVGPLAATAGGGLAAWFAARQESSERPHPLLERAATGAGVAAVACALTAIGVTWSSQRLVRTDDSLLAMAVPLVTWTVGGAGLGISAATLLRFDSARVGRHLFALGVGAALGGLLQPSALVLGCPRTVLLGGFLLSGASWLFVAATGVRRHRPVLISIPLVLLSLSLGDIRYPWMKVRTDVGRKGRIGLTTWTSSGLLQVDAGKAGTLAFTVDRGSAGGVSLADKSRRRQPFELPDMAYFFGGASGSAWVVGAGGGREVREALDAGHASVDALERSAGVTRAIAGEFAAEWRSLLEPTVSFRFGEPTSAVGRGGPYERVVVVGAPNLEPLGSRFLVDTSRELTVDAIRRYRATLDASRGILLLRGPKRGLPDLLATLVAATPEGEPGLVGKTLACAERRDDGAVGVLTLVGEPRGPELASAEKSCKRKGLTVELTTATPSRGDRDKDRPSPEERLRELAGRGRVLTDDRPFLEERPTLASVRAAARDSLRALRAGEPRGTAPKTKSKGKGKAEKAAVEPEAPAPTSSARMTTLGIATSTSALALLVLLGALFAPGLGANGRRAALSLRVGVPLHAVGMGVASLVGTDILSRMLGGLDAGTAVVLPTLAASLGAGALLADVFESRALPRALAAFALATVVVCLLTGLGASRLLAITGANDVIALAVGGALLVTLGMLAGGTTGTLLRLAVTRGPRGGAWAWGTCTAGVPVGVALAQLLARFWGISALLPAAACAIGLGAMTVSASWLRAPAPR